MSGIKISQLPAVVTPALTDIFPIVQSGTTYKETITQLASLVSSNISNNSVTNAMLSQMGAYTIKGNNTNATANAADIAAGQYPATHTNDSASAGNVGEYLSTIVLSGAAVAMTTTVSADVASLALTAGDWDVWAELWTSANGATTTTLIQAAINTVSATLPTVPADGTANEIHHPVNSAGAIEVISISPCRVSLAAPATIYFVANITFAVNTMATYGKICARRRR